MVEIILTIDKRTDHIIKTQLREKNLSNDPPMNKTEIQL